jgi:RimJ/RimL family protein N-acetyltransferase
MQIYAHTEKRDSKMHLQPIILTGSLVHLEPLTMAHAEALLDAQVDDGTWDYMSAHPHASLTNMQQWIQDALDEQLAGSVLPFVIRARHDGNLIGSTRYLNVMPQHRGLEIGWTWIVPEVRSTNVNTECKYLLLQHAFEVQEAIRVQFKTDSRNLRSQRAIERLGAVKEGILRNHVIMPDGYFRHSVYYSITDQEWPQVKERLQTRLQQA